MQDKVITALKTALEMEDKIVNLGDAFREYEEWDSLARMSLIAELDENFGVGIDSADFEKIITVGDLVNEVQRRCS